MTIKRCLGAVSKAGGFLLSFLAFATGFATFTDNHERLQFGVALAILGTSLFAVGRRALPEKRDWLWFGVPSGFSLGDRVGALLGYWY